MTLVDAIASSAFLGGWMHTPSNLLTRFPYLTNDVSLLLSTDNVLNISIDIHQAAKSTGCNDCQHLSEFVKQPKKLQQNHLVNYMRQMQIPAWKLQFHNQIELQLNLEQ